jgi:hypothetical protein
MNAPASSTITPVFVADLFVEGERMPVYVHVIDHPDARVLVDTGMTELHPAMAEMDPRLRPLSEQDCDLAGIDIVVNTHLHADHCGGSASSTSRPPKASSGSLRSTPSSSGSRTSTSRGDPAPTKASHRRGRMSTERLDRTTGNGVRRRDCASIRTRSRVDAESDELGLVAILEGVQLESRAKAFRGGSMLAWFGGVEPT